MPVATRASLDCDMVLHRVLALGDSAWRRTKALSLVHHYNAWQKQARITSWSVKPLAVYGLVQAHFERSRPLASRAAARRRCVSHCKV